VYSFGAFFDSMAEEFGTGRGATPDVLDHDGVVLRVGRSRGRRPTGSAATVLIVGALSLGIGLIATSWVDSIWVGYVTTGSGVARRGMCVRPMVAVVGGWFVRQRTTALGVSVAGIGAGTLVLAPLSQALIESYGWRTAYVWMGIVGTGCSCSRASARTGRRSSRTRLRRPACDRTTAKVRRAVPVDGPCVARAVRPVRVHQVLRHRPRHRTPASPQHWSASSARPASSGGWGSVRSAAGSARCG
jgi:MFS family permease